MNDARPITQTIRDKVLEAFNKYAEGGTIGRALDDLGLCRRDFYRALRQEPSLQEEYLSIQKGRADMMVDEAYAISTDSVADPKRARVQADIRLKIAGNYDRARFGEKVDINMNGQVDITAALLEARNRTGRPAGDLIAAPITQAIEVQAVPVPETTDKETVALPNEAANEMPNPFDD